MAKAKLDYTPLYDLLDKYGQSVVKEAVTRLESNGKVNTGKLKKSLSYEVVEKKGSFELLFYGEDYLENVDKGRRPGATPPPIEPIKKWVKQKGLEPKAAYPIAKHIGKYGIKPTNFFTIPTTRRQNWLDKRIEDISAEIIEAGLFKTLEE